MGRQEFPHAIHVITADMTDREGAIEVICLNKDSLCNVKNILVDAFYTGEQFSNREKELLCTTVEVVKRSE